MARWATRIAPFAAWWTAERRRSVLSMGAAAAGIAYPWKTLADRREALPAIEATSVLVAIPLLLAFLFACHCAARAYPRLPTAIRRRPQFVLHLVLWSVVATAWAAPEGAARGIACVLGIMLPFLVWRCAYLLRAGQRRHLGGERFADQLWILYPVWGGTNVPFGKGPDHLARHKARSATALARSQLAGLRLLVLAALWWVVWEALERAMSGAAHRALVVPRLGLLLDGRASTTLPRAWASVYGQLVRDTLHITVNGHIYVGVLRLLGFHVWRNTYKPFLAESVVAFWNRQYFYFKELMVEFFFLPTFTRWFRGRPRLRIVAACLAAACVGNTYYHLLLNDVVLLSGDPAEIWQVLEPRLFYGLLLASAIAVSMQREARRRTRAAVASLPRRAVRIAATLTLLAVIRIWAAEGTTAGAVRRAEFALGLVGVTDWSGSRTGATAVR